MAIEYPQLDDRSFDDLVAEARALAAALAPGWTDHNVADPGITVLELFAWITETLVFQLGRIPPARRAVFLDLIEEGATDGAGRDAGETLEERRRRVLAELRAPVRAVTAADHEYLVSHVWPAERRHPAPHRVLALPGHDLGAPARTVPADVCSVVVLPDAADPAPVGDTVRSVQEFLDERRMLGTRVVVVGPQDVPVTVHASLALRPDAVPAETLRRARDLVATHLDPVVGGPDGLGWPFGRPVRAVELTTLLAEDPGVDYVEDVRFGEDLDAPDTLSLGPRALPRPVAVVLRAWDVLGVEHRGSEGAAP